MGSSTIDAYHYVRFSWTPLNLEELQIKMKLEGFSVELHEMPKGGIEIALNKDWNRDHLHVKADTLEAYLAGGVATLLQHKAARFTKNDVKLRRIVFDLYTHSRPTVLSLYSSPEPKFETE
jgi:hypothetical protein